MEHKGVCFFCYNCWRFCLRRLFSESLPGGGITILSVCLVSGRSSTRVGRNRRQCYYSTVVWWLQDIIIWRKKGCDLSEQLYTYAGHNEQTWAASTRKNARRKPLASIVNGGGWQHTVVTVQNRTNGYLSISEKFTELCTCPHTVSSIYTPTHERILRR